MSASRAEELFPVHLLDPTVVADLRDLGLGDQELTDLIDAFAGDVAIRLQELRLALDVADPALLARTSHTLKGSTATMGAASMGRLCAELETRGIRSDLGDVPDILSRLEAEFKQVRPALQTALG